MLLFNILCILLTYLTSHCTNADANLRIAFTSFSNLTNQFLSTVNANDGLNVTKKYIKLLINNGNLPSDPMVYVNDLWQTYIGYIILIIIGIGFIIIFTIVGCCCCCCRCCCNRCGAKPPGPSKTNTKKQRIILNIFLIIFTSMIAIGAIVAMASNVILLDAIKPANDSTDKAGNMLATIDSTLVTAISYINTLASNGIIKGSVILHSTLQSIVSILSGVISLFTTTFLNQLNYNTIINATINVIAAYKDMVTQSQRLNSVASFHQNYSSVFASYIQTVYNNLTNLMNSQNCQNYSFNCQSINNSLQFLVIGFNVSKINYTADMNTMNYFNEFNISNMEVTLNKVIISGQNFSSQINSTLTGYITEFANAIDNSNIYQTYNSTFSIKDTGIAFLKEFRNQMFNYKLDRTQTIENGVIYTYYRYVFYGFIFLIGIIFLVAILFYVGLFFGICGGPNFEDSSCCSKGAGSGFLMGGVAISFIFGWLLMLFVLIMFIVGGMAQTEVCSYINGQSSAKSISTIDEILNSTLMRFNVTFSINNVQLKLPNIDYVTSLLTRCPTSTDIISAFKVPSQYITLVSAEIYNLLVAPSVNALVQRIKNYTLPSIDVLTLTNDTNKIIKILTILLSFDSGPTLTELKKPVTLQTQMGLFITSIRDLALIANSSYPDFANSLNSSIIQLDSYNTNMTNAHTQYLTQKTLFLRLLATTSPIVQTLSDTINSLPSKTSDAKLAAVTIANSTLIQNSTTLVNQTVYKILVGLGDCQGLAAVANSAIGIFCNVLLIPFNNMWMGMGWFLLFIIPSIVIALKLHRLYRISHIETNTSEHSKAYQCSNHFLSENDMEMIRTKGRESIA